MAARRMHSVNALAEYHREQFVINAFAHVSTRLSRTNPLTGAFDASQPHLHAIGEDLAVFYPALMDFCDEWKQTH